MLGVSHDQLPCRAGGGQRAVSVGRTHGPPAVNRSPCAVPGGPIRDFVGEAYHER